MERCYWLDLFTGTTWKEFLDAGGTTSGFPETRWSTVKKIKAGDYLLCYLTGLSRWVGVLEVTGEPFRDDESKIWKLDQFPARIPVTPIVQLDPLHAAPIISLQNQLSIFRNAKSPTSWTGAVRSSPAQWSAEDGEAVLAVVREAERNPVARPFDPKKLAKIPERYRTQTAKAVTIPENGVEETEHNEGSETTHKTEPAQREHSEIQYLLLKLGSEMGLDVWVARNDRSQHFQGKQFSAIPRCISTLPIHFDEATNKTIELIDVLWLNGNTIVAAFEIESTTSVYSGLLRMSDLIAMQPNLNIPLFLVAPDGRRDKVVQEINRPTFARLTPPMTEMCRFIPFSALREQLEKAGKYILDKACAISEIAPDRPVLKNQRRMRSAPR
jgi:hypothetical protein